MKRLKLFIIALVVTAPSVFGGGLVTNVNQSAAWARTLSRDASTDVDAVYFNPAGLGVMSNGLHLSLSNQSIFQTQTITSSQEAGDQPTLSGLPKTYEGTISAPLFPSIYAAYKMDKWAFSVGFNIIGGGGGADFTEGLNMFEMPYGGAIVPLLQSQLAPLDQGIEGATGTNPGFANITDYISDAAFKGSSRYYGFQVGATYSITDMISVAIGARYVSVSNSYEGSMHEFEIEAPAAYGGFQTPGNYLRTVAGTPGLDPVTVATLNGTAAFLDAQQPVIEVNATQSGSGFTPIIGVNLHLTDMLNVGVKYEHHTKIELTNETTADSSGLFQDGVKSRADLPSMFSVGVQFKPIEKLSASVGFNYFVDKPAYYGNIETDQNGVKIGDINNETTIDENAYTFSASLEYKLLGILGVSAGFSTGNLGANDNYQSDLDYALKSKTVAGGVFVDVGEMLTINAGVVYVMYDDYSKSNSYQSETMPVAIPFADTFGKNTTIFAIGVDINL